MAWNNLSHEAASHFEFVLTFSMSGQVCMSGVQ